ncbi:hypothetical protein FRC08_004518 [Ceratobasidium sp. 394]|nr:hypothetical protein FRC08_004518 [Ceratobasidium sp. 394]KAG9090619.1 hypothetical protein FS749_000410 [Ceratobasidium sp. UAMH 11750]
MDAGIIASFKAQYKRRFVRFALDRDDQGVANMYNINQLQAMTLANDAWQAVTPQTIYNCWRHVGLVPPTYSHQPPLPAPDLFVPTHQGLDLEAQQALDQLSLNFPTEAEWTDQEIVDQLLAERLDGLGGEEEEYDMVDFVYHHYQHT